MPCVSADSADMTNSVTDQENVAPATKREPRPFLFIDPMPSVTNDIEFKVDELQELETLASASVQVFVRSLVNFTIALQNRRALEHGNVQPIQLSVLNRRRRAAREWIVAIVAGKVDAGTCYTAATQWLPTLCGTGPDVSHCVDRARNLVEFVRGSITASIFAEPAENLVPQAKALYVLENVLAMHFGTVSELALSMRPTKV